ncbi:hypothetical protein COB52_00990 [Candidatus Kaiserbacteria bacterium]|nr:MAG: hypothetical protein COB52_00990 [Candidatus Kaiserbacteria bacterium]
MIELELTYLAKELPKDLFDSPSKKIVDLYVENGMEHSDLRIRRNGDEYELTRKRPTEEGDASKQVETTIPISDVEFESFSGTRSKVVSKTRYYYEYGGTVAEFDIFENAMEGLVVIDFEFNSELEKDEFAMPAFCLADVTQEKFIAGGMVAGKGYGDLEEDLNRFGYKRIDLP